MIASKKSPPIVSGTPAACSGSGSGSYPVLTAEQVASWQNAGFCLVNGILPQDLVEAVRKNCVVPEKMGGEGGIGSKDNSFNGLLFPCLEAEYSCVNDVTLHPHIITACSQLLGCAPSELRLSQSELWSKINSVTGTVDVSATAAAAAAPGTPSPFDTSSSQDQRVHVDGFNHYLTFPTEWDMPEAVAMIVYYDDTSMCGGGTRMVPRAGTDDIAYHNQSGGESPLLWTPGGRSDLPWLNARSSAEAYLEENAPDVFAFRQTLYEREMQVHAVPGTILFYRLDIWHRGVPLVPGGVRRVQNMIYKRQGTDWLNSWNAGSARNMYTKAQTMERIIATSTMQQRCVLGFPTADSTYWTPYTLAATKARYRHLGSGLQHMEEIERNVAKREAEAQKNALKVFVYGTLLTGLENSGLMKDAKLVSTGRTVEELYMVSNLTHLRSRLTGAETSADTYKPTTFEPQEEYPYPFLMRRPITAEHAKSRIAGEVYEVSPESLVRLDTLEDHPVSYFRTRIPIELADGSIENINMYMLKSEAIFAEICSDVDLQAKNPSAAGYYQLIGKEHSGSWRSYIQTLQQK